MSYSYETSAHLIKITGNPANLELAATNDQQNSGVRAVVLRHDSTKTAQRLWYYDGYSHGGVGFIYINTEPKLALDVQGYADVEGTPVNLYEKKDWVKDKDTVYNQLWKYENGLFYSQLGDQKTYTLGLDQNNGVILSKRQPPISWTFADPPLPPPVPPQIVVEPGKEGKPTPPYDQFTAIAVASFPQADTEFRLWDQHVVTTDLDGFVLDYNWSRIRACLFTQGAVRHELYLNPAPHNKKVHYAITYDGVTFKFYINGVLDSDRQKTINSQIAHSNENLRLGADSRGGAVFPDPTLTHEGKFAGTLQWTYFYLGALNADQVKADVANATAAIPDFKLN